MKIYIYRFIHKLGFRIVNMNNEKKRKLIYLSQFAVGNNIDVLLQSYDHVFHLKQKFPELSIITKRNGYEVSFSDLFFFIESNEEFFILKEVYVTRDYSFNLDKEVVVIDIGANIGLSSLYFSKKENVKKIFSFEPVKDTYDQAIYNFNLNPSALSKIQIENIGLAGNTREDFFLFDNSKKGRSGVRGAESNVYKFDSEKKKVYLKEASIALKDIVHSNTKYSIVIKMDCEGAEYEIFENINSSGLIKEIEIFMIEWHDKGYGPIEKILVANNFVVFNSYIGEKSGMIYAVNRKK
jgi:FkbM family methyltransferase